MCGRWLGTEAALRESDSPTVTPCGGKTRKVLLTSQPSTFDFVPAERCFLEQFGLYFVLAGRCSLVSWTRLCLVVDCLTIILVGGGGLRPAWK